MRVLKVKFTPNRRLSPVDNPVLTWALHVVVVGVSSVSAYYSLIGATFVPAACGIAVVSVMEAGWLYFRLRR
jgi:uncharacterized membrane protein